MGTPPTLHTYETCLFPELCEGIGKPFQDGEGNWIQNVCLEHTTWDVKKNRWEKKGKKEVGT